MDPVGAETVYLTVDKLLQRYDVYHRLQYMSVYSLGKHEMHPTSQ